MLTNKSKFVTNPTSPLNAWRIIIGGSIGNLTEWYNLLLYGYLAPIISQLFFPIADKLISLTLVFTVFALSFFVRPIGGILFGWIGDTYGRKWALIISLIMMAVPTLLIGCLPTYASIGIASPILLSLLRVSQGISTGGEHTGSAVYIAEYAPANRRSLWVTTVPISAALGILMSSTASLLMIHSFSLEQLLTWGWRVGFWFGALLCLISLLIRIRLPESPDFHKLKQPISFKHHIIFDLFQDQYTVNTIIKVFALASSWGIFYQILFIWMPTYLSHLHHISKTLSLQINSLAILLFACLIPILGYCADKVSRKWFIYIATSLMFVCSYPLFLMLGSDSLWQVSLAMIIFTIIFSLYIPATFILMVEAFHINVRYTAFSFAFNLGLAIFGGTCPLIATWLIVYTADSAAPAFYMMLAALIALLVGFTMDDKRGQNI